MVKFPCPTELDEGVTWAQLDVSQSDEDYIYLADLGMRNRWRDRRFTVLENQSHSFVIYNVTVNDSAYYRCVEAKGYGHRHFYRLTVEGIFKTFQHSAISK